MERTDPDSSHDFTDMSHVFAEAASIRREAPRQTLDGDGDGPWLFIALWAPVGEAPLYACCASGQLVVASAGVPASGAWPSAAKAYGKKARSSTSLANGAVALYPLVHVAFAARAGGRPALAATSAAARIALVGRETAITQFLSSLRPRAGGAARSQLVDAAGDRVSWAPCGPFAAAVVRTSPAGVSTVVPRLVRDLLKLRPPHACKAAALTNDARDALLQVGRERGRVVYGDVALPKSAAAKPPVSVAGVPKTYQALEPYASPVAFSESAPRHQVLAWVKGPYLQRCTTVDSVPIDMATRMLHVLARYVLVLHVRGPCSPHPTLVLLAFECAARCV